jgi:predicted DCC family thiol-disulfide oxidoreductase YuxK
MPERPILLYDGDCAFCSSCARALERIHADAEIVAWQLTDLAALGVTAEQARDAVQWVALDGAVSSGHEAIAALLESAALPIWRAAGALILLPGVSSIAAAVYRLVAKNRHRLPGGTPACAPARDEDKACAEDEARAAAEAVSRPKPRRD